MIFTLDELIKHSRERTDALFTYYLRQESAQAPLLQEAMAYAVFNGGKRLRPLLVYATGQAVGATFSNLDAAATAVEFIHAYSLIHDDLPAMDNSDLRRGKPSCHKQYGEAMAILAGDALQTLAFNIIASHPSKLSADSKLAMITILSEASGINGMAGGQALDIATTNQIMNEETLLNLYELKTGNLLAAAVKLGSLAAPHYCLEIQDITNQYAKNLGLAFQIQDDLLDIEGTTALLGKPTGIDQENHKVTYPILLGVTKTKQKIKELVDLSISALQPLGKQAIGLEELALYFLARKY